MFTHPRRCESYNIMIPSTLEICLLRKVHEKKTYLTLSWKLYTLLSLFEIRNHILRLFTYITIKERTFNIYYIFKF